MEKEYHTLRKARKEANLNQEELAKLSGVSPRVISNIENFHTIPYRKVMLELAVALNIPVKVLFPKEWKPYKRKK